MSSDAQFDRIFNKIDKVEERVTAIETTLNMVPKYFKIILGAVATILGVNFIG